MYVCACVIMLYVRVMLQVILVPFAVCNLLMDDTDKLKMQRISMPLPQLVFSFCQITIDITAMYTMNTMYCATTAI